MLREPKVEKFRSEYQSNMDPKYNPWIHMGFMWGVASLVIILSWTQIVAGGWLWLILVPIFVALNFLEWAIHKFAMHRRINLPGLIDLYERHTCEHHRYFTESEMTFDTLKEMRIVAFPWQAMLGFLLAGILFGCAITGVFTLLGFKGAENAGYITLFGFLVYYLLFDLMHVSTHFDDNIILRNTPFINTIRRLHAAHHKQGQMSELNMNLTFPIADYCMKTSDLKRGFFGTIFNGYNEKYVNK